METVISATARYGRTAPREPETVIVLEEPPKVGQSPRRAFLVVLTISVLAAVVLVLSSSTMGEGPSPGDAGDEISLATQVGSGAWNGSIDRNATQEDLADFYRVPFEGGSRFGASLFLRDDSSTYDEVTFRVYDRTYAQVVAFEFTGLGMFQSFGSLTNGQMTDPVYYMAVTWDGSSIPDFYINYTLTVSVDEEVQDDAGTGEDVGGDVNGSYTMSLGKVNGSLGGTDSNWEEDGNADGVDSYSVVPEMDRFLVVRATLDMVLEPSTLGRYPGDLMVRLENGTGFIIDQFTVETVEDTGSLRYYPVDEDPLYIVLITTAEALDYSLEVGTEEPGADGGKRADAGGDTDHAMDLEEGTVWGIVLRGDGATDDADFYELELEGGRFLEVTMTLRSGTRAASNLLFHVVDYTKGEVVNFTFSGLDEPRRFAALTHSENPILRYYFGLTWAGGDVDFEYTYELTVDLGVAQSDMSTGKDVTNGSNGAPSLGEGTPVGGTVGGSSPQWAHDHNVDGADAYEVLPTTNKFLVVRASLDTFWGERRLGFDVRLEDQAGDLLGLESVFELEEELELRYFATSSLPLYVIVVSESEMCNYTVTVSIEAPPDVDILIEDVTLTPSKPEPLQQVTVTVILRTTTLDLPTNIIRVEIHAGGDLLEYRDLLLETTQEVVTSFTWTTPSTDTDLTVMVDTLDAVPFETNEGNNARTLQVKLTGGDGNGGKNGDDTSNWLWIGILVGGVAAAIIIALVVVVTRGHEAEDDEPEDY
jgi:hypothetical protein